jgi:DNA-binding NarL/FixJ family response regulator
MEKTETIEIVIVDDHKIVRDGIKAMCLGQKICKIIGEASDYQSLMDTLANKKPDMVLLDISMPGKNGIEITKELREKFPCLKVLILSSNSDEQHILEAIKAGANGFLSKDTSKEELLNAIAKIHRNENYFGEKLNAIIFSSYVNQVTNPDTKPANCLSEREVEIMILLAEGFSNKEIADKLFISPRTIDTHKANIMSKLELNSSVDLVKYAIKHGYIKL